MPKQIAKLTVVQNEDGMIEVDGEGALLKNKAFAYGLLELAKDVIRADSRVQAADRLDLSTFGRN
jgi:hypothetical protein